MELLAKMLTRGTITIEMKLAGERFNELFNHAHKPYLSTRDVQIYNSRNSNNFVKKQTALSNINEAKDQLWNIIIAAGGGLVKNSIDPKNNLASNAPISSAIWYVLGLEKTIKSWAEIGWNNKPISQETASGILIASLGFLQRYYFVKDKN